MKEVNYMILIEALSSCAIEGNKYAIETLALSKSDPEKFFTELDKLSKMYS